MKTSCKLSRRELLRGAGASISLPILDVMSTEADDPTVTTPVRAAYLYIPNGVADGAWQPEEVGSNGNIRKLNRWMKSLEPVKDQITIFKNLWTPRGNGHIAGTATWLTGGAFNAERIDAGGTSVDKIAAKHFSNQTLLPSLDLSVRGEGIFTSSLPRNSLSWVDHRTPAPRDVEPRAVFDRMFRAGQSGLANQSVLDLIIDDTKSMKRRVSDADRRKIDEYLESIRAIERRIQFAEAQKLRAAQIPALSASLVRPPAEIPQDHGEYVRSMMDMIVLAFWSDASRVSSFMLDHGQSNRYFNFIDGVKGTWHALSHWKDTSGKTEDDDGMTSWSSRDEKREMYNRVTQWHTEQVAYLIKRLASIEENGKTLLDSSSIVYGSSLADGHEHAERDLPVLVAGRGGGAIRPGRVIGGRRPHSMSALHLSILKSLGIKKETFAETSVPLDMT